MRHPTRAATPRGPDAASPAGPPSRGRDDPVIQDAPEAVAVPPPVFIITCMRSYSSLVCGMLGQHPELYGLPEVNLAVADRVSGMQRMFRKIRPASLHGLYRTVAELEFGGQTDAMIAEATAWIEARRDWTTAQLFRAIAGKVAPRALVEKSPTSVAFPKHLDRLLVAFPDARFLHLTRHPRPTCRSIHALISATDSKKGTNRAEMTDPEKLWRRMNANAFDFMDRLPVGQGMRIRGEDLLADPDIYFPQICTWLGIRSDADALAAMKHPERSPFARLGPPSARFGNDPNYLNAPEFRMRPIPEATLDGPLDWTPDGAAGFARDTRSLAHCLGYL